jgi:putative SOS response-associated peptidase YedK
MCGRYTLRSSGEIVAKTFALDQAPLLPCFYNVAPTQAVAAVRLQGGGGKRELVQLRWGLIPSWSKDAKGAARMINARAETVATKPAFRSAFRKRRCLVAADGFYEWQKRNGSKQPFYIRLQVRLCRTLGMLARAGWGRN